MITKSVLGICVAVFVCLVLAPRSTSACCEIRSDVNHDLAGPNVADLTYLVNYLFRGGPSPPCIEEADVDHSGGSPPVTVNDITYLVAFLFEGGSVPDPCPLPSAGTPVPFGDTVEFADLDIRISFDSVAIDNRCPLDVYCFWQGVARIHCTLWTPDETAHHLPLMITGAMLYPDSLAQIPIYAFGYRFTLVSLLPYPLYVDGTIPDFSRVAGLDVVEYEPPPGFHGLPEPASNPALEWYDNSDMVDSLAVFGDSLGVFVSYTGGCVEHYFTLYDTGHASDIEKPLLLYHLSDFDPCDAWIQKLLRFSLEAYSGAPGPVEFSINGHTAVYYPSGP